MIGGSFPQKIRKILGGFRSPCVLFEVEAHLGRISADRGDCELHVTFPLVRVPTAFSLQPNDVEGLRIEPGGPAVPGRVWGIKSGVEANLGDGSLPPSKVSASWFVVGDLFIRLAGGLQKKWSSSAQVWNHGQGCNHSRTERNHTLLVVLGVSQDGVTVIQRDIVFTVDSECLADPGALAKEESDQGWCPRIGYAGIEHSIDCSDGLVRSQEVGSLGRVFRSIELGLETVVMEHGNDRRMELPAPGCCVGVGFDAFVVEHLLGDLVYTEPSEGFSRFAQKAFFTSVFDIPVRSLVEREKGFSTGDVLLDGVAFDLASDTFGF